MEYDGTFSPWRVVVLLGVIAAFAIADKWITVRERSPAARTMC